MKGQENDFRVLSAITGRVRMHVPQGLHANLQPVEKHLERLPGVRRVQSNPLTGNVLIHFDAGLTNQETLVEAVTRLATGFDDSHPLLALLGKPTRKTEQSPGMNKLVKAGLYGVAGHVLIDAVFYAITFSQPFGLPLAPLGVLHLGLDVLVWTATLGFLVEGAFATRADKRPTGLRQQVVLSAAG